MKKIIALITLLCVALCTLFSLLAPPPDGTPTSTGYRYEAGFEKAVGKYADFAACYEPSYLPAVPGLKHTNIDGTVCTDMVPQGLCIAGDYLLITAYDAKEAHNSVVYVLSHAGGNRGEYLATLVLPNRNHAGGIAFDGSLIWIAQSSDKTLKGFSYETLQRAVASGADSVRVEYEISTDKLLKTASLVTYYDGLLWVGTFAEKESGILYGYQAEINGDIAATTAVRFMELPAQTQGVSFVQEGGKTALLTNCSYGRKNDARLHVYYPAYDAPADSGEIALGEAARILTLPPMLEEIDSDGDYTYCLFESAATKYSTVPLNRCLYPVDRIVPLRTAELIG